MSHLTYIHSQGIGHIPTTGPFTAFWHSLADADDVAPQT
jgi:hypothetical protein